MLSRLELLIDLLHSAPDAALATHSTSLAGFPFASAVSFATDEHHRPILLISSLAEHARNLAADARASLMIAKPLGDGEMARVSLQGEVRPIDAEPALVARYLRYHPHAERFLQLGDFRFHRFDPLRVLTVGGFARAGWLEGERLLEAPAFSAADEMELLARHERDPVGRCRLRGLDPFGADALIDGEPVRIRFDPAPVAKAACLPALADFLSGVALRDGP